MTKRLPPHEPAADLATQDEVDAAVDDDAMLELVPKRAAVGRGGTGLAFAMEVDLRPTQRAFELLADLLEQAWADRAEREPKKLPAKRKRRVKRKA